MGRARVIVVGAGQSGLAAARALRALEMPVLLLGGETSPAPVHAINALLASVLPRAASVALPGVGHMGPLTHPAEVREWIRLRYTAPLTPGGPLLTNESVVCYYPVRGEQLPGDVAYTTAARGDHALARAALRALIEPDVLADLVDAGGVTVESLDLLAALNRAAQ